MELDNLQIRDIDGSDSRAWYGSSVVGFLAESQSQVLGKLLEYSDFEVTPSQRDAWVEQIGILRRELQGLDGFLMLEFSIPRMGRRIDAVLLTDRVVFALEFKIGSDTFDRAAIEQVWDYALDLKNFHEASHQASIVPVLVASEAVDRTSTGFVADDDQVYRPVCVNENGIRRIVELGMERIPGTPIDIPWWPRATYRPSPTIVEAARALYSEHSVEAIARFDAGATNLRLTSKRLEELVDEASAGQNKLICFVTGVPGAGKTLVGLNVATRHRKELENTAPAVFLSGNGPLVAVLREALTRDEVARRKKGGEKVRKGKVGESVKAFIQNVHHFRDDGLKTKIAPVEHIVIFDEAQRAWNVQKTSEFMRRKKNHIGFAESEPEFLISYMDRHTEWAVIICLVGGGTGDQHRGGRYRRLARCGEDTISSLADVYFRTTERQ